MTISQLSLPATTPPPGTKVEATGTKDFSYLTPGMVHPIRVTTHPQYYDQHSDSVALWSPGSPIFPLPDPNVASESDAPVPRQQFLEALTNRV